MIFSKPEVIVYKDAESYQPQIEELLELKEKARGSLKAEIEEQIRFLKRGEQGEDEVLYHLKFSKIDLVIIRDLYLKYEDLTAQIDYYVIAPKCNYLIECKNMYGNITVNQKGEFIRNYTYNGKNIKEGMPSPIAQSERHMQVLKNMKMHDKGAVVRAAVSKYFEDFHKPLVVMANSKTVVNDKYAPKAIKEQIIKVDNIAEKIKSMEDASTEPKTSKKKMLEAAENIVRHSANNDTDYVAKFRKRVEEQNAQEKDICPFCGAELVVRNGKNGEFIGCSAFPKCRYTRNI